MVIQYHAPLSSAYSAQNTCYGSLVFFFSCFFFNHRLWRQMLHVPMILHLFSSRALDFFCSVCVGVFSQFPPPRPSHPRLPPSRYCVFRLYDVLIWIYMSTNIPPPLPLSGMCACSGVGERGMHGGGGQKNSVVFIFEV